MTMFARLESRALVHVAGPEWRSFLQGLITQDVDTLQPGEARFGALLTPQGRLLFDLFLYGEGDGVLIDVAADRRDDFLARLKMYRLRAKVDLALDERLVTALWNTSSAPAGWMEDPRTPQLGFRGVGLSAPEGIADEAAYEAHRLAIGVPGPGDFGQDATYAIEADFDLLNGIDFQKGCFVGQETTSRMKRRGQIKTRMLPIAVEGETPAPGAEVLMGELRAGVVGSGLKGTVIATLRLDRIAGGLTVEGSHARVLYPDWYPREMA